MNFICWWKHWLDPPVTVYWKQPLNKANVNGKEESRQKEAASQQLPVNQQNYQSVWNAIANTNLPSSMRFSWCSNANQVLHHCLETEKTTGKLCVNGLFFCFLSRLPHLLCFVFTFKLITLISSWLPLKLEKAAVIKRYDPWREQAIRTYKPSWWVCLPLYFLSFTLPVRMKWDTLNY